MLSLRLRRALVLMAVLSFGSARQASAQEEPLLDAAASAELEAVDALQEQALTAARSGDARAANAIWEQALSRMEALAPRYPTNSTIQAGLARAHLTVADSLTSLGSMEAAWDHCNAAARIQDEGLQREPNAIWLLERVQTRDTLADLHLLQWQLDQAFAEAHTALESMEPLTQLGLSPHSLEMLTVPQRARLAQVLERMGRWSEARDILLPLEDTVLADLSTPDGEPSSRGRLMWIREMLGDNYRGRGMWYAEEIEYRLALEMSREDLAEEPGELNNINSTAWYLLLWGRALHDLQRDQEAQAAWIEARDLLGPALNRLPLENASTMILDTQAQILMTLGEIDAARPIVERLLSVGWCMGDFVTLCQQTGLLPYSRHGARREVRTDTPDRPL